MEHKAGTDLVSGWAGAVSADQWVVSRSWLGEDALEGTVGGEWASSLYWSENEQKLYWNWHILWKAYKASLARLYSSEE